MPDTPDLPPPPEPPEPSSPPESSSPKPPKKRGRRERPRSARGQRLLELASYRNVLDCAWLTELYEFDRREEWKLDDATSAANWLSWYAGIRLRTAHENLRVARKLAERPVLAQAMREGRVNYTQARALTRIATVENETTLVELAVATSGQALEGHVRHIRQRAAADAGEVDPEKLRLWWSEAGDGTSTMTATMRADQGATVRNGLEAMKRLAQPKAPGSVSNVDALVLMATMSVAAGAAQLAAQRADGDEKKQRRLETTIAKKSEALLIVSQSAVVARTRGPLDHCELSDGTQLSVEAARRLLCDSAVRALLVDDQGNALDVGRRTQRISEPLKAALIERDRHCTFPGCTSRLGLDAHHRVHWLDGGETKLDNLTLQCRPHHVIVHEGGHTIVRTDDGLLEFLDRAGDVLPRGPGVRPVAPRPSPALTPILGDAHLQAAIAMATREALRRAHGA